MLIQIYATLEPYIDEGQGAREKCKNKGGKGREKRGKKKEVGETSPFEKPCGHFGTSWDILGQLGSLFDKFGASRLFSQSFPTVFSHNRLIEKKTCDGRTDGPTDGQTLL